MRKARQKIAPEYEEEVRRNISRRLKSALFDAGMGCAELSRRTTVPAASIYNAVARRTTLTAAYLSRIADELGCSTDWLLGRTEEKGEKTIWKR